MSLGFMQGSLLSAGSSNDASTTAWINAVVADGGSVSATQQTRVNTLIVGLKADNLFTILDRMWLFAGESDAHQAKIDIVSLGTTSVVSAPVLAAGGYTGDGIDDWINSNYNPSTAGGILTLNSSSIGFYDRTSRTSSDDFCGIGCSDGTQDFDIYPRFSAKVYFSLNDANGSSVGNTNAQRSWTATRTAAASYDIYENGTLLLNRALSSSALVNKSVGIGAFNAAAGAQSFSTDQIAAAWLGGALDATQVANLSVRVNTYMTAWGVNVY